MIVQGCSYDSVTENGMFLYQADTEWGREEGAKEEGELWAKGEGLESERE